MFPKKGPVRRVIEKLPREQEELELAIGRKFQGSLAHFEEVDFHDLSRGPEPMDLTCKSADGQIVGIQIVEVVNDQLRQLRDVRSSYKDAIQQSLGNELLRFNGCRLELVDSGEPPYLPRTSSAEGQGCLKILVEHIRQVANGIQTLDVGKTRVCRTRTSNPEREVAVFVDRLLPSDGQPIQFDLSWQGGGPVYRSDVSRGLLTGAVQSKIAKRYVKPAVGKFVLLAYSVDTMLRDDEPDVGETRHILEASQHPFDEVWFLFPYADADLGALIRIWPVITTNS